MEAALRSGETDTSQLICSANLISHSLRQQKSSLELGGDGFGTFQSLLPLKYQEGVKTRRHAPGDVCPSEEGLLDRWWDRVSMCVVELIGAHHTQSHRRWPMSPCVGSPTDKRSLKIYKVLMCSPCRRCRMDVLTNAPKQMDGSEQYQVLFFLVSPGALNVLINAEVDTVMKASIHMVCSLAQIRAENIVSFCKDQSLLVSLL